MPETGRRGYLIGGLVVFLVMVVTQWWSQVGKHEALYLIGSRCLADPTFLAGDFIWSHLPPTTFVYDHLLAPLWSVFDEFTIANIGRFAAWFLTAWSLTAVARAARLPAFALPAGFTVWMLWGQTLVTCGAPLEGLQVKSFAYPMVFFALAFAMQGRIVGAGLAAGLGVVFHIIVGGWGCLAVFLGICVHREHFSWRAVATYLGAAAPFILPLLGAVALFHDGGVSAIERVRMDEIYVSYAVPWCGEFDFFMQNEDWVRTVLVFSIASALVYFWPRTREGNVLRTFVMTLIALFFLGEAAQRLGLYGVLKVLPAQLGLSLPALFLFILIPSFIAAGRPARVFGRTGWALILVGTAWLILDRNVAAKVVSVPRRFIAELQRPAWGTPREFAPLYEWVRTKTPPDSLFITPYLWDFWSYAERRQVATFRHPPLDRRLLEWKTRLEAVNGFQPFTKAWKAEDDLEEAEGRLTIEQLVRIRELYGATHYVTKEWRLDLADWLLYADADHAVYDVTKMTAQSIDAPRVQM